MAYSPDGRWLAIKVEDDKSVLLLDAQTHETIAQLGDSERNAAAFSPDSRLLATCSQDYSIRVWDLAGNGRVARGGRRVAGKNELEGRRPPCMVLSGHTDEVFAVTFHPDSKRLATAGRDGAVWLWDVARGEDVVRLPGHKSYISSLAFSPDGETLVSGSGDFTLRLWDTAPLKTRYQARREAAALRPQAERLVEHLWREKNDAAQVIRALRADQALREPLRHAAFRALLRRVQPPETTPSNPGPP